jgi:hypothetical protein
VWWVEWHDVVGGVTLVGPVRASTAQDAALSFVSSDLAAFRVLDRYTLDVGRADRFGPWRDTKRLESSQSITIDRRAALTAKGERR